MTRLADTARVPAASVGLSDGWVGGRRGRIGRHQYARRGGAAPADRHAARPGIPAQDGELGLPDRVILCSPVGHRPGGRLGVDPGISDGHGYGCRYTRPYLPGTVDGNRLRVWAGVRHDPADNLAARSAGLAGQASRGTALRVSIWLSWG